MQFTPGTTLVHPQHGPATVVQVIDRSVAGATRTYVQLQVQDTDLRIAIPLDQAEHVGLRPVSGPAQVAALMEALGSEASVEEAMWSRRMKANHERLRTGDLLTVAALVRDIARRDLDHGVSAGEKDLLKQARRPLVTELALALGITEDDADARLEQAVLAGVVDTERAAS